MTTTTIASSSCNLNCGNLVKSVPNGGSQLNIDNKISVAIIGSGIAGLSAAHELNLNGFTKVTILEASNRTGGRIFTHALANGK